MPKTIPDGLTKDHVLLALKDLDEGIQHEFGDATGYQLVHEGKAYAPKAVVGIAFRHLTGTILDHGEFSGGEKKGQANYVLRGLGFSVEPIQPATSDAFITSRGYSIPEDWEEFEQAFWFNMWQKRMWPYYEVEAGHMLFWYDSQSQRIVWKSVVSDLDKFEYERKQDLRDRLIERFGEDPATDPYYADKAEKGYCIAFKVTPLQKVELPKPDGFKFPQGGWLRGNDEAAKEWLSLVANLDGLFSDEIQTVSSNLAAEGYFDPTDATDERQRRLREIVQRRGQPQFRKELLKAYGERCAVTGCDVVQALEAAHIRPFLGDQSNHVTNGVLLRADIHTLFDLQMIGVEPGTLKVKISDSLVGSSFEELNGRALSVPSNEALRPSEAAIEARWKIFEETQ
ncbi:HNH endonuclease [Stieleria sp. JC731]|uniref:HNH endonuclease n=1 Tax=Pirellulaceae TaxID=2691357 RepID=UPI001E3B2041|nr:HNH endonuclease [Stieleria sp. JC731]MCC9602888.1 HNH endonuclease [Stieleria sp. JC731]